MQPRIPARPAVHPPAAPRPALPVREVIQAAARSSSSSKGRGGGDVAAHNWDNVLCQYNGGSAGREVDRALADAGYHDPAERRRAALRGLRETRWAARKIAHGLGGQQSEKRGGTDEDIQSCKRDLLAWVARNPAPAGAAAGAGAAAAGGGRARRRGGAGQDDDDYDREAVRIGQLALFARQGDREALNRLREMAAAGNPAAMARMAVLEPPLPPPAAAAVPPPPAIALAPPLPAAEAPNAVADVPLPRGINAAALANFRRLWDG